MKNHHDILKLVIPIVWKLWTGGWNDVGAWTRKSFRWSWNGAAASWGDGIIRRSVSIWTRHCKLHSWWIMKRLFYLNLDRAYIIITLNWNLSEAEIRALGWLHVLSKSIGESCPSTNRWPWLIWDENWKTVYACSQVHFLMIHTKYNHLKGFFCTKCEP